MFPSKDPNEIFKKHWLKPGSVKVGNVIATGAYGRVYEGKYGGLKVAIKDYGLIYDKLKDEDKQEIMEEFQLMKDLNHTNTTRVYGFILNQRCLALVMEFANRGTLKDLIETKRLQKDVLLQYHLLLQTALAMRFIHSEGILHRDLKPDNVLVFEDKNGSFTVKIADFGESRRAECIGRSLTKGRGTFTYMDKAAVRYGNNMATDIYSYCVLASEVLNGQLIPVIPDLLSLEKREDPMISDVVPKKLRDCLQAGFVEDQQGRPDWTDIIVSLRE